VRDLKVSIASSEMKVHDHHTHTDNNDEESQIVMDIHHNRDVKRKVIYQKEAFFRQLGTMKRIKLLIYCRSRKAAWRRRRSGDAYAFIIIDAMMRIKGEKKLYLLVIPFHI
jgi:hypothetical protein